MLPKILIALGVLLVAAIVIILIVRSGKKEEPPARAPRKRPPAKRNWLVGQDGSTMDKAYHVGQRTVTIGRGVGNFIQITDENVSRKHCQITPTPSGLQVVDFGTSNPSKINGEVLDGIGILQDGQLLMIGSHSFKFHVTGKFVDSSIRDAKTVGKRAQKDTVMGGMESFSVMVEKAMEEHNGNVEAAAQSVGLDVETFVAIAIKAGLLDE